MGYLLRFLVEKQDVKILATINSSGPLDEKKVR